MNMANMLPHQLPQPSYRVPMLGQGGQRPEAQQHQAQQAAIGQAIQQLSMGIYSRIASRQINGGDADEGRLQQIAKDSMVAARAYFEAMGVIERSKPAQYTPQAEGTEGRPEANQETRQAGSQAPQGPKATKQATNETEGPKRQSQPNETPQDALGRAQTG